jgi:hypothetical protein
VLKSTIRVKALNRLAGGSPRGCTAGNFDTMKKNIFGLRIID